PGARRGSRAGRRGPGRRTQCRGLLMSIPARFHDGETARTHVVALGYEAMGGVGTLVIHSPESGAELGRWPAADLYTVHGRKGELRLGATGLPEGARVVVQGRRDIARILATLPLLSERRRHEARREIRLAVTATLALASVILAYLYGVPLLAGRITGLVPAGWEQNLGETVARQMEAGMGDGTGWRICDPDPDSLANRAIARFGAEALAGSGSPFDLDIKLVKSDIPNAFALPGG